MGIALKSVLELFVPIKQFIYLPKTQTDNFVFRLHYLVTAPLLFLCCLIITVGQYFGNPISCLVKGKNIPQEVMNTYCWIHSTFILPKNVTMEIGSQFAHPGVGSYQESDEKVHADYYLWVAYVLFFQGTLFLLPMRIWEKLEDGRIHKIIPRTLVMNVDNPGVNPKPMGTLKKEDCRLAVKMMKDHFITRDKRVENRIFLHKFAFCEFLNLLNVLIQISLIDRFLGGVFSTYGSDILSISMMDPDERNDPLDLVFPKVGKCTFHKYGPSGTIQLADSLCILSLNIVNEKFYIIIWFWFIILAIVSGLQLVWRAATMTSRKVRESYLRSKTLWQAEMSDLEIITQNISLGDWFTLTEISENIDERIFKELMGELATAYKKIDGSEYNNHVSTTV